MRKADPGRRTRSPEGPACEEKNKRESKEADDSVAISRLFSFPGRNLPLKYRRTTTEQKNNVVGQYFSKSPIVNCYEEKLISLSSGSGRKMKLKHTENLEHNGRQRMLVFTFFIMLLALFILSFFLGRFLSDQKELIGLIAYELLDVVPGLDTNITPFWDETTEGIF